MEQLKDWLKERLTEYSSWVAIIGFLTSVIVYFTPDNIDTIIYELKEPILLFIASVLAAFGFAKKDTQ